jgi:thiol:disulfide interchange protein DsbA
MNRREFSARMLAGGVGVAALAAGEAVRAQGGAPVEGTHYVKLSMPVPVVAGQIEVVEFFWYGCPHCNAFEPTLDAWSKRLPPDVAFRRVHVALNPQWEVHQKIFYALEAMGQVPAMHRKVFYAIHGERQRLDKPDDIAAFMQKNGIDGAKFLDTYKSFTVQTKARQASKLAEAYKIDGVPTLGVQGKYYTSPGLAGSAEGALQVVDHLIRRERKA